jgi:hypothetical protein
MVAACPADGYRRATIPGLPTPIRFSRSKSGPTRPAPRLGSAGSVSFAATDGKGPERVEAAGGE